MDQNSYNRRVRVTKKHSGGSSARHDNVRSRERSLEKERKRAGERDRTAEQDRIKRQERTREKHRAAEKRMDTPTSASMRNKTGKKRHSRARAKLAAVFVIAVMAVIAVAAIMALQETPDHSKMAAASGDGEKTLSAQKHIKSDDKAESTEVMQEDTEEQADPFEKGPFATDVKPVHSFHADDATVKLKSADTSDEKKKKSDEAPAEDGQADEDDSTEVEASDKSAETLSQYKPLTLKALPGTVNDKSPDSDDKSRTEQITSTNMILVDLSSDAIVAERDADQVINPASMTKILTLLTASDYVKERSEKVKITQDIIDYVYDNGCSAVGFVKGETVTVDDLLYGTILCSGADAALGLAKYCCGSVEAFVERMNAKAAELGISDTAHFTNPVGVYDKDLHCTAEDMAVILSAAVRNPLCREVLSKHTYTTTPDKKKDVDDGIEISNWFLRRIEDKETGGEVICAKTGFVNESGCCAASYMRSESGKEYVCVTVNTYSSWRCIYDHVSIYRSFAD